MALTDTKLFPDTTLKQEFRLTSILISAIPI